VSASAAPPAVVVQLSDPHIGAAWTGDDPSARLAAAVERVAALRPAPAAVLVTGDLVEHSTDAEYEQVRALLAGLPAPVHVLPGNHDDRAALRRHFGLPGRGDEPIGFAVDLGPLRVVLLDTQRPGEDGGALDSDRLAWLDRELGAGPAVPTVVAMHHPPFPIGVPAADAIGIPEPDRRAFAAVLERHPQVLRVVAGHVHRAVAGVVAGRPAVTAPSTYAQLRLDVAATRLEMIAAPAGFLVHVLLGGELATHVEPIP
jgi:3',5'-cyclic-AMP phosphodiesterase